MLLGICVPGITIDPSGSTTVPLGKLLAESIVVPAGNLMPGGITTSSIPTRLGWFCEALR